MPLTLPNLDDLTFTDLMTEARAMIPAYVPGWTNHNEADPGITLVELFAFLTEMLTYRINRITDANNLAFLRLMKGPGWNWTPSPDETLADQMRAQIRAAVLELREPNRAVTGEDFVRLALAAAPGQVARASYLPGRDLEAEALGAAAANKPGHVSVIIVPSVGGAKPQPGAALIEAVKNDLEPRRLLTTQVHVVGPLYFAFGVCITLALKPDTLDERLLFTLDTTFQSDLDSGSFSAGMRQAFEQQNPALSQDVSIKVQAPGSQWLITDAQLPQYYQVRLEDKTLNVYEDIIRTAAVKALRLYFDPLKGGEDGRGWPFGRNVYVSEVYQLLDTLPGVDYVKRSLDPGDPQKKKELDELTAGQAVRLLRDAGSNALIGVEIKPEELIDVLALNVDLTILSHQT